ncbi:hypothetical protein [Bradyrhizobium ivorense]|uniref:hypothetical protein n=1 Tax=Bradyrhizobium ivorense TaxID=2511166 RepID=UPI003556C2D6
MKNTNTLLATILLASTIGIGAGRAAPLPTNVAAMKGMVDNGVVEARWGGWGGGWRGGWGYRGWRGGYGGWGYRGWGAAAAGAIVGGAIASSAYGGYPYYGGGYGYGLWIRLLPAWWRLRLFAGLLRPAALLLRMVANLQRS